MDKFQFNLVNDLEYEVIILCAEIMQRNINCFDDAKGRLLIGGSISNTIKSLRERKQLSPIEFLAALHSIELCALALCNLETINKNDLKRIQPHKKIIKELHRVYGTLLYL